MAGRVLGLDLAFPNHPTAAVALAADKAPLYLNSVIDDSAILGLAARFRPDLIAIDAPLTLPQGLCCLESSCPCGSGGYPKRSAERALAAQGIGCFYTTKKSLIKGMVYRGVSLATDLRTKGYQVIEVYPYASKVRLWGKPIPRKTTPQGLEWLRQRLGELLPGLQPHLPTFDHNLCDAAVAAYIGWLHLRGRTRVVGREDGPIVLPAVALIDTHPEGQLQ